MLAPKICPDSSMEERGTSKPRVEGSNPSRGANNGGCRQVVKTMDCGSIMRGFESHHPPQVVRTIPIENEKDVTLIIYWMKKRDL